MNQVDPAFAGMKFYVVRNREGKYFRAKGRDGSGATWVVDPLKARVYNKLGPARACVSFFATKYPSYGTPVLVVVHAGKVEVLDETDRVTRVVEQKRLARKKYEAEAARRRLENAEYEAREAEAELRRARDELTKHKPKGTS